MGDRLHRQALLTAMLLLMLMLGPSHAQAHSVKAIHWQGSAIVVQTNFGGGEPAGYASVVVLPPGEMETEYQTGVTDANGRFAFLPDRPGQWRVIIDAGMGHRTALVVEVAPGSVVD